MCDVKRIRYETEPFTKCYRMLACDRTSCAHSHDERKQEYYTNRLIQTVNPCMTGITHTRHHKNNNDDQRAPPESAFHLHETTHSGKEQTGKEGIKESGQPNIYLRRSDAPSPYHRVNIITTHHLQS